MAEYIIKQKVTDRMGCCLANAKAEYKAAKDEFTKARFGDYISAIQAMIDVVECSEAADVKTVKYSSWEYRTYPIVDRDGTARRCMRGYVCKACGHGEPEEKRFCGGCGAEMRGDDND